MFWNNSWFSQSSKIFRILKTFNIIFLFYSESEPYIFRQVDTHSVIFAALGAAAQGWVPQASRKQPNAMPFKAG